MNGTVDRHLDLGRRGEQLAERYLRHHGLTVLARNWRCATGELDLVAMDRDCLVVCEVKTRAGTGYGAPAEAVSDTKADRIHRLAAIWRTTNGICVRETRFDIISVLWPPGATPRVEHLVGAF